MNSEQLPLVNGLPLWPVVPGCWVNMLSDIGVLDRPDTDYRARAAYAIPDTPYARIKLGETDVKMIPINRMVPRSSATNMGSGGKVPTAELTLMRSIAFGGDCAAASVDFSTECGQGWHRAELGKDEGKYGFRQWQTQPMPPIAGEYNFLLYYASSKGEAQNGRCAARRTPAFETNFVFAANLSMVSEC
jgi:hypothetical protein